MAITSFENYEIPAKELDAIKSALVRSKIRDYIKTNGTAPDDSTIAGFYNIPDDIMSVYKRTSYARYREEQYEPSNAGGGSAGGDAVARKYTIGDIICWSNSTLVPVKPDAFSASSGTPVGVVAIPDNFLPDGKARIISCMGVNENGTTSTTEGSMTWGPYGERALPRQYMYVACVGHDDNGKWEPDNTIDHAKMIGPGCYMPILNKSANKVIQSPTDPSTYWIASDASHHIASPFDGENLNPSYCATKYTSTESGEVTINNALSDFNGLENTRTIAGKGSSYPAAWACNKFATDGIAAGKWYLPAAGELGFMLARFDTIQASLNKIKTVSSSSAVTLGSECYSTSTEFNNEAEIYLYTGNGYVSRDSYKSDPGCVRPWAQIS